MSDLTNISPLDGRYQDQTKELNVYFSEAALIRYRLLVEVEYLIALSSQSAIKEIDAFSQTQQKQLRRLYQGFSMSDAREIKDIEKETNHDVKAVEYFLKQKIATADLKKYAEFIHFALTSEDVNNLAYSLMLKNGLKKIILPALEQILNKLKELSRNNKNIPLLSLTHGQPATPTTIGKELAVFYFRVSQQVNQLKNIELNGKLNGATGNYAAAYLAYPEVNWLDFSRKFITSLGLKPNLLTTQIEPHDSLTAIYDNLARINNILRGFSQDMWLYISRGIFKLKPKAGEVGSSTMPHKVNPINFENSEGNFGLANALLRFLADKLTVSRLQRDLTDSTVIRNQGAALGYSLLAYKNTLSGLTKIEVDESNCQTELNQHWEVLTEAAQTVLRKIGYEQPYEKLKELTRGEKINKQAIQDFIASLDMPNLEKKKLLNLSPATYIGLADKLTDLI